MKLRNAIRASLAGLSVEEKRVVADALHVSVSTLYQYAEDTQRCHLRADQVAEFCAVTANGALLEAIQAETVEAMDRVKHRGQLHLPGTVTDSDLLRDAHDLESEVWETLEDGVVSRLELKKIWMGVTKFIRDLVRFERGKSRGPRPGQLEERRAPMMAHEKF